VAFFFLFTLFGFVILYTKALLVGQHAATRPDLCGLEGATCGGPKPNPCTEGLLLLEKKTDLYSEICVHVGPISTRMCCIPLP
jgi:hypothetical protein